MEDFNRYGANWRSGAGYSDHGERGRAWAWEFLRRNRVYQAAWEQFHALAERARTHVTREQVAAWAHWDGAYDHDAVVLEFARGHDFPDGEFTYGHFDPPKLEGETYSEYRLRIGGRYTHRPMSLGLGRDFGLEGMIDPRHSWAKIGSHVGGPKWLFNPYSVHRVAKGTVDTASPLPAHEWHDGYVIDYREPLDVQLEAIRAFAAKEQERLVANGVIDAPPDARLRKNEYPRYLRILDALEDGAEPDEIAGFVAPTVPNDYPEFRGRATVQNGINAAKELRDGGYRRLVRLNPKMGQVFK